MNVPTGIENPEITPSAANSTAAASQLECPNKYSIQLENYGNQVVVSGDMHILK